MVAASTWVQEAGYNRFVAAVTEPSFFSVLRVQPAFGRAFTADECQPGHDDVVVLSHGFAERQFGSARNAVGRTLDLSERSRRIIGVMPGAFELWRLLRCSQVSPCSNASFRLTGLRESNR